MHRCIDTASTTPSAATIEAGAAPTIGLRGGNVGGAAREGGTRGETRDISAATIRGVHEVYMNTRAGAASLSLVATSGEYVVSGTGQLSNQ